MTNKKSGEPALLVEPREKYNGKRVHNCIGAIVKKIALASFALLLLLVAVFKFSSLAIANPVPYPTEPSQEFPTLKVNSPENGEVFRATTVEVNFTVTKPDSWNFYWLTTLPVVGTYDVLVYLDGNLLSEYPLMDPGSSGFPAADYSVSLQRLTRGSHAVKIDVEAFTYYDDPSSEPGDYLTYSRNITEMISFTVNADLPTPSPTSTPTSEPQTKPFPTTMVIAPIASVVIVGLGVLLFFKNRRR
jgi:hypothetical protein